MQSTTPRPHPAAKQSLCEYPLRILSLLVIWVSFGKIVPVVEFQPLPIPTTSRSSSRRWITATNHTHEPGPIQHPPATSDTCKLEDLHVVIRKYLHHLSRPPIATVSIFSCLLRSRPPLRFFSRTYGFGMTDIHGINGV